MKNSKMKLAERIIKYHNNQHDRGYVQVRVWVPRSKVGTLKAFADNLRQEWKDLLF